MIIHSDGNSLAQTVYLVDAAIAAAMDGAPDAAEPDVAPPAPRAAAPAPARPVKTAKSGLLEVAMRLDNHKSLLVRMVALVTRIVTRLCARIEFQGLERISEDRRGDPGREPHLER